MRSGCFGCDVMVEGDDAEAVADAFLAHSREAHDWPYPEHALRNYAKNWAEAEKRLTGATERLPRIGEITVHPVTTERIDDWLRFFDHDGFADNPDWASCYCLEPHVPTDDSDPERYWRDSREAMRIRLADGGTFGYLAYVDGSVAGWVNASTRPDYAIFGSVEDGGPDPKTVVGVSCFVIAPPYRRHGVAAALLDHVIADAPARHAAWVEGYPHADPEDSDGGHFRGPRSMYDDRGFEAVEERERYAVMRRAVP